MCIGNKDKRLNEQRRDRQLQWVIISQYKEKNKPPHTMQDWWPIEGDKVKEVVMPTQEELIQFDADFKSLGKKNG